MIAILDCKMGNLRSVFHGVDTMGFDCEIITYPQLSEKNTHLIIPGVGNFHQVMTTENIVKIKQTVLDFVKSGRPILGICLGMQLLADWGEEGGGVQGLGLIRGKVEKMDPEGNLRLPHVGWNSVNFINDHPVFDGVKNNIDCYFVHSYNFICDKSENIYAYTDYGEDFISVIGDRNVLGLQFHPEKSQNNGLKMLENFCDWDGRC